MKTPQRVAAFALLLAAGCATAPAKPPFAAFETLSIPAGLDYRPADSAVIETPDVRAGRVLYRGRVEPQTLAAAMRSNLETDGWKPVGIGTIARSGSTQEYTKGATSLRVRVWEGGFFSWYTYLELAAVETGVAQPSPGAAPGPEVAPKPAAAIPASPASVATR